MGRKKLQRENQEQLKQELINFKVSRGVAYRFWYERLHINKGTLSHWIKGDRDLPNEVFERLEKLVEDYKAGKI